MSVCFSVIVPIYKVEPYLKKCIDSILAQRFLDFELLLIDDGSPDGCPQICDEYAERDQRVRVIHKENRGLVAARNTGIQEARGEYICYVDGDDWIDEKLLETVYYDAIVNHRPDMVIYGIVKKFENHDEEILNDLPDGLYEKAQLERDVYPYMMYDNRKPFCKGLIFPAACNKIYKRSLLLEHYCRDERIKMGEDNAFVYECAWFSQKIYICNKILYYYNRLNEESMGNHYDPSRFENNRYLISYLESRLLGLHPDLDEQINAFKAYWLIMAVFHEVKSGRPVRTAAKHVKEKIKSIRPLDGIHMQGLPIMAKGYLILLRLRLYRVTLLATSIVNSLREKR